jgi:hypothetical protein
MFSRAAGARPVQNSRRQGDDRSKQVEHTADGNSDDSERQQEQPTKVKM